MESDREAKSGQTRHPVSLSFKVDFKKLLSGQQCPPQSARGPVSNVMNAEVERSRCSADRVLHNPRLADGHLGEEAAEAGEEARLRGEAAHLIQRHSQHKDGSNSGQEEEKKGVKANPYYGANGDLLSDKSSVKTYSKQFS